MSGPPDNPPQVAASVLAELTEQAPNRVRKKLDRDPQLAAGWQWEIVDNVCRIDAGGEQVELQPNEHRVERVEQVRCSCLLSPRCFHVLATLSILPIAEAAAAVAASPESENNDDQSSSGADEQSGSVGGEPDVAAADPQTGSITEFTKPTEAQREAARQAWLGAATMLAGGARAAGVLSQAALLRAAHECRLAGLHRLGNATLRLVASLRECRDNADTFESDSLLADLLELFRCSRVLQQDRPVASGWYGVARRRYTPRPFLKVHGLCCEPLVTRSGYAGVVSYFADEDGRLYSVSDVRPGDAERISAAYRGGLDLGGVTSPHRDACRASLLMQHGSTSDDGRIGGGQKAKGVVQSSAGWTEPAIESLFARPLDEQITRVFEQLTLSEEQRRAGWDLLFVHGELLGGDGASLVLQLPDAAHLQLLCPSFADRLAFADNFRQLSRRQGAVRCIARLLPGEFGAAMLIALAQHANDDGQTAQAADSDGLPAAWQLPEAWNGRVNVGLDKLQGSHLLKPSDRAELTAEVDRDALDDGLDSLRRRLRAIALGGRHSRLGAAEMRREIQRLDRQLLPTGALLLERLTIANSPSDVDHLGSRFPADPEPLAHAWLAGAVYENAARAKQLESHWLTVTGAV